MKKRNHLAFAVKCADCVHFSGIKSVAFKDVCSKLGIKQYANACTHFTPAISKVGRIAPSAISALNKVCASADSSQLRLLALALQNITEIRKLGFEFAQQVWFNLSNPVADVLECYYTGFIVGATETHIHVASDLGAGLKVSIMLLHSSVRVEEAWIKHRNRLIKAGKICLPKSGVGSRIRLVAIEETTVEEDDYVVPTLEFAPKEWLPKKTRAASIDEEDEDFDEDEGLGEEHDNGSMTIGFE